MKLVYKKNCILTIFFIFIKYSQIKLTIMKKTIILFLFLALPVIYSCSSDDDNNPAPTEQTNAQKEQALIDGSPWLYNDLNILNITFNPAGKTEAEAYAIFNDAYYGSSVKFNSNHTGTLLIFGTTHEFSWSLSGNGTKITLDGITDFAFLDISVNSAEFKFTFSETCQTILNGNNQEVDICVESRFIYK